MAVTFTRVCARLNYFTLCNRTAIRAYSRGVHRHPVRVFTQEQAGKLSNPTIPYVEETPRPSQAHKQEFVRREKKAAPTSEQREKVYSRKTVDEENVRNYSKKDSYNKSKEGQFANSKLASSGSAITLKADGAEFETSVIKDKTTGERKLSSLMLTVKSPKARKASNRICLEGERLISDALKAGAKADSIFFSRIELLNNLPLTKENCSTTKLYQINYNQIQLWSDLTTSPGIIGVFEIPDTTKYAEVHKQQIPLTIVCDNIRDPGNMGSILRCAAAVGCKNFITTSDCVDVWDSKVLRSAAGAHFRIHMHLDVEWELLPRNHVSENATVVLADSMGPKVTTSKSRRFSNQELANALVQAEEEVKNSKSIEVLEGGAILHRDSSYSDANILKLYKQLALPYSTYDDLKLSENAPVVLVIGGEAHGLSSAAHKLAHDFDGHKVFIPLENEVDSLNAGVACGILAYEIRRQILNQQPTKTNISNVTVL